MPEARVGQCRKVVFPNAHRCVQRTTVAIIFSLNTRLLPRFYPTSCNQRFPAVEHGRKYELTTMLRFALLSLAFTTLLAGSASACRCKYTSLTDHFDADTYETIGVFCNGVPSRPFPDLANQVEPIEWTLQARAIYKGDCSLVPDDSSVDESIITVTSGAHGALCGVNLDDGCYVLGITEEGSVNSCGPTYDFENLSAAMSAELEANNQCSSDCA